MTHSAEDYPHRPNEPWTNIRNHRGLERLHYIADRALAQTMYELWQSVGENERQMDIVKRAHTGMLGEDPQRLALDYFGETLDDPPMAKVERFVRRIATMRQAQAGKR